MTTLGAYIRLMRPANIVTAVADILLGFAASGALLVLSQQAEGSYLTHLSRWPGLCYQL